MIKIGIFFIGLFLLIAFYEMNGPLPYTFSETAYSNYPVWLLGIILIFIGYYRKSKSDEHAKEWLPGIILIFIILYGYLVLF